MVSKIHSVLKCCWIYVSIWESSWELPPKMLWGGGTYPVCMWALPVQGILLLSFGGDWGFFLTYCFEVKIYFLNYVRE